MTQDKKLEGDHVIFKMHYKRTGTNNGVYIPKNRLNRTNNEQLNTISNLSDIKIAHLNINGLRNKVDL